MKALQSFCLVTVLGRQDANSHALQHTQRLAIPEVGPAADPESRQGPSCTPPPPRADCDTEAPLGPSLLKT